MRIHLRTSGTGPDQDILYYTNSHHRVRAVYGVEQPTSSFHYRWRTMLFPHAVAEVTAPDLVIVDSSTKNVSNPGEMDYQLVSFAWDFAEAAARRLIQEFPEGNEPMSLDAPEACAVHARNQLLTAVAHMGHYHSNRAIAWEEWYSWTHNQRFARLRVQSNPTLREQIRPRSTYWRLIPNWDELNLRSNSLQTLTAETQELQRKLNHKIFE